MKTKLLFYAIMLLSSLFLLSIIFSTLLDLHEINKVDPDVIYQDVQQILAHKKATSFPLPPLPLKNLKGDSSKKTVYIFGESSLIVSNGKTFPVYLAQEHSNLYIVNLAILGIESTSIKQRVGEAISSNKPDIIILYYGHNDYNNLYHKDIIPKYFNKLNFLLRLSYILYKNSELGKKIPPDSYESFARMKRPLFLNLFMKLKFLNIDVKKYERINQLCLNKFITNTNQIIMMARAKHIPVILITPVGNLRAEPCGDTITTMLYQKGMAAAAYEQSMEYLKSARDREIFTYDIRAKSPLVDFVRNFVSPNVYVLDLEKKLEEINFDFGFPNFEDYFHFNDNTHRLVAKIIYDFMASNKLI